LRPSDRTVRFVFKPTVFLASLGPFVYLVWAAYGGHLSANPLGDLTNETGVWTLRFLCITLAITPLRKLSGWNPFVKFRRMAGLFAFFYGTLHLMTYAIADRFAGLEQAGGWVDSLSGGHLPGVQRHRTVSAERGGGEQGRPGAGQRGIRHREGGRQFVAGRARHGDLGRQHGSPGHRFPRLLQQRPPTRIGHAVDSAGRASQPRGVRRLAQRPARRGRGRSARGAGV